MNQIDLKANQKDVAAVLDAAATAPSIALILGSGLDSLVDSLSDRVDLPYAQIEGMQSPHALAGHAGTLSLGTAAGKSVMCFRGRVHRYQGVTAYEAAYPARLAAACGASTLVVTNAAGSLTPDLPAGTIMLISDHINLTGDSPLVGWPGPDGGTPFIAMGDAYDPHLRELARLAAAEQGIALQEGVYAGLLGPAFETPAEVRYLRTVGADAVGMSTVPEVIAARALGLRVLGLSMIANAAGGSELSHQEVLEAGIRGGEMMTRIISAVLSRA